MTPAGIRFWNRLHIRITLYGCIIAALALLPLSVHHFLIAPSHHRSSLERQLQEQGQALAVLIEGSDPHLNWLDLGLVSDALSTQREFSRIVLLDGGGKILYATDSSHYDGSTPPPHEESCRACHGAGMTPDTGSVTVYVGQDLRYIRTFGSAPHCAACHSDGLGIRGHLLLEKSVKGIQKTQTARLRQDLLLTSLVVFLAIATFYIVVRRVLIRRLVNLEMLTLSPLEKLDLPADRYRDELSRLARTIRSMRASLVRMFGSLEEQKSFLAHLLESLDDGIVVVDAAGDVLLVNQRLFVMLELPAGAMRVGRSWRGEVSWPPRLSTLCDWIEAAREFPGPRRDEVSIHSISRDPLHLECHSTPLSHPGAIRPPVLLSIRDITERKGAQKQLYRAEKLATVGQLAAGLAHEINNPLACILTCASGLSRSAASDATHRAEYIDIISSSARRCKVVTDKLLSYAARGSIETRDLELGELLQEATDLLQFDARRKRVQLSLRPTEGLPRIEGDRDLLLQVFVDLTLNAIQAVKRGGRVELSWGRKSEFLWVTVADNGPGIPQALHDRVFDPFFTTKRVGEGTGLGLSVSLGIVRQHGGTLELVKAYPGRQGACFRVTLPLQSHLQRESAVV